MSGEWDNLQVAIFKPDDEISVYFAVLSIKETGGNRLVKGVIPFRRGVKLDSTVEKERSWSIETVWHNTITEKGLLDSPRLYPERMNAMLKLAKVQATGTLDLPLDRNLRVRCDSYTRVADRGMRDGEVITFEFVEDNEDDEIAAKQASVKATIQTLVEEASFDADSIGGWNGSFEDLTQFASDLQGLMNAPGDAWAGIEQKADRVAAAADKIEGALTGDPDEAPVMAKLVDIADSAARAKSEGQGSPKTVTRTFPAPTDIYTIAASLGQSPSQLLALNTGLRDPGDIPAGTPVVVLAK